MAQQPHQQEWAEFKELFQYLVATFNLLNFQPLHGNTVCNQPAYLQFYQAFSNCTQPYSVNISKNSQITLKKRSEVSFAFGVFQLGRKSSLHPTLFRLSPELQQYLTFIHRIVLYSNLQPFLFALDDQARNNCLFLYYGFDVTLFDGYEFFLSSDHKVTFDLFLVPVPPPQLAQQILNLLNTKNSAQSLILMVCNIFIAAGQKTELKGTHLIILALVNRHLLSLCDQPCLEYGIFLVIRTHEDAIVRVPERYAGYLFPDLHNIHIRQNFE